jgi:hypothetical protein
MIEVQTLDLKIKQTLNGKKYYKDRFARFNYSKATSLKNNEKVVFERFNYEPAAILSDILTTTSFF